MIIYRRIARTVIGSLFVIASVGCQKAAPPAATQQQTAKSDWSHFVDPRYAAQPYEEFGAPLRDDLDTSQEQVSQRLEERIQVIHESGQTFPEVDERFSRCDWFDEMRDFRLRDLDHYNENTTDSGEGKVLAAKALDAYINFQIGCCGDCPDERLSVKQLLEWFQAAFDAGAKDQTIQTCHAGLLWADQQNSKALEKFSQLAIEFDDEQAAPVYGMYFRAWHWELSRIEKAPTRAITTRQFRLIDAIVEFLASDKDDENLRSSWQLIRSSIRSFDAAAVEDLLSAMMERDDISLYNKHLVAGYYCYKTGWDRRGSGFANTVSPAGWEGFQEFMTPAKRHFERAWQLHPELADAPAILIQTAMAGFATRPWTTRDWFLQAIAAEFDFSLAYSNMRWASRPRWGGSHESLLQIGMECIETNAWKTSVPAVALDTIYDLKTELPVEERLASFSSISTLASNYARGHAAAFDEMANVWQLSKYRCDLLLSILIENDDFAIAGELIKRYPKYYESDEGLPKITTQRMIGELEVMLSDGVKEIGNVRKILNSSESASIPADVTESFLAAAAKVRTDLDRPTTNAILNHYEEQIRQRSQFYDGDWVEIRFAEDIPGWRLLAGETKFLNDSKILLDRTSRNERPIIELVNEFPLPLTLEATFKIVDSDPAPNQHVEVGINLGAVDTGLFLQRQRCFFGIEPNIGVLTYDNSFSGKQVHGWDIPHVEETNRIRIEYWNDAAIVYINDKPLNRFSDLNVQPGSLFSFGPFLHSTTAACSYELSNVRLRKQDEPKTSRIVEYHQQKIESSPNNPSQLTNYARALRAVGRYDEALEQIKKSLAIDSAAKSSRFEHYEILFHSENYLKASLILEDLLLTYPNDPLTLNNAAWFLATCPVDELRDGERAVKYSEQVCELTNYSKSAYLDTLAATYAEVGRYSLAAKTQQLAVQLSPENHRQELMNHLNFYLEEQPFRHSRTEIEED